VPKFIQEKVKGKWTCSYMTIQLIYNPTAAGIAGDCYLMLMEIVFIFPK
jgi:hypothetical protein